MVAESRLADQRNALAFMKGQREILYRLNLAQAGSVGDRDIVD